MALIKNIRIRWVKCNPARPNASFNKENPTWELQVLTTDKAQLKELTDMGIKMNPTEEDGKIVYKGNIKKKSKKADGSPNKPVEFVLGNLQAVDPDTVGNDSIANIRVFEREYESGGKQKKGVTLMKVQVTTLNVYVPKAGDDDFDMTETQINQPVESDDDGDDNPAKGASPKAKAPVAPEDAEF